MPDAGGVAAVSGGRVLGVALIGVAVLGASGLDLAVEHWLDARLPAWVHEFPHRSRYVSSGCQPGVARLAGLVRIRRLRASFAP